MPIQPPVPYLLQDAAPTVGLDSARFVPWRMARRAMIEQCDSIFVRIVIYCV